MVFASGIIVVDVDLPSKFNPRQDVSDLFAKRGHHARAVFAGIVERKVHFADVRLPFFAFDRQPGEIGAGGLEIQFLRDTVMVFGHFEPEIAGAGMNHQPDKVVVATLDFEEVVAAAKRAEVAQGQIPRMCIGPVRSAIFFKTRPLLRRAVSMALPHRNGAFDVVEDAAHRGILQGVRGIIGLHGDHAAADIHADGVGNNRLFAGNHAADGHAAADVTVGHKSNVMKNFRMVREMAHLFNRTGIERLAPRFDRYGPEICPCPFHHLNYSRVARKRNIRRYRFVAALHLQFVIHVLCFRFAGRVVELVDTQDLGSCAFGVRVRVPPCPL